MAKIGISIKIDVTKIDKARLYKGAKGTYLDLTTFIDTDNPDQYDNHGFISQSVTKEERDQNTQTPILGNSKVFYNNSQQQPQQNRQQPAQQQQQPHNQNGYQQQPQSMNNDFDDDIPF